MSDLLQKPRRVRLTASGFGDYRLDHQYSKLTEAMTRTQGAIIHQLSARHSERIGFYRFLANQQVSEERLVKQSQHRCHTLVGDKSVLVLHDTSELDYSYRPALRGSPVLGPIGNGWGYLTSRTLRCWGSLEPRYGIALPSPRNPPIILLLNRKSLLAGLALANRWLKDCHKPAN